MYDTKTGGFEPGLLKQMKPFLQALAEAYAARYADMSRFRFVFPSRRSGTFFRGYLKDAVADRIMMSPDITTISDLAAELSGRIPDNRIDLLFTLYDAYRDMQIREGVAPEKIADIDSFRSWGDVVLDDFNDVDLYCVNADEIFKNVRDFREIETDYLTDEQREVMAEYFGEPAYKEGFDRFWKSYAYSSDAENKRETGIKDRFIMLWQSLAPLYHELNARLEAEGLSYPGMSYRLALKRVFEKGADAMRCDKAVFVGFNALTKAEWLFFQELKKYRTEIDGREEPFADFFWDDSAPWLREKTCSAAKFILKDAKQFPSPEWADLGDADASGNLPEIKIISSPSNALQTKIAGKEIGLLRSLIPEKDFDSAKVAVVLPDENLLLPMLYSLPQGINDANITMGFSLKLTSASAYVQLLRRLQRHKRQSGDEWLFLAKDVSVLFSHPFLVALCGLDSVMRLKGYAARMRRFMLTSDEIIRFCPQAEALLRPLTRQTGMESVREYLDSALMAAASALRSNPGADGRIKARLDLDYIDVYSDALRRLSATIGRHGIEMDYTTFFSLTDRMLAGETVNFEGEPTVGLQVMGLLETRCLDFEHIIIPSMNERIFPRKMRSKSFIPANLRRAFGMPSASYDESIFAYYFYRLICRAKTVSLIYDSRTSGMQSGDASRYVHQLKYLYSNGNLSFEEYRFGIGRTERSSLSFTKSQATLAKLAKYAEKGSGRYLSASSLMKYLACPVSFYYEKVLGVDIQEEIQEGLDPIMTGNIVHHTLMEVYMPERLRERFLDAGVRITESVIDGILADRARIRAYVCRNINRELFPKDDAKIDAPLTPDMDMTADILTDLVCNVLKRDRSYAPLIIHGVEFREDMAITVSDEREVNITCTIDRLDRLEPDGLDPVLRIIDYKTGSVHAVADTAEDAAQAAYKAKHLFQLQLYANLHNMFRGSDRPIKTVIYDISRILKEKTSQSPGGVVEPKIEGKELAHHLALTLDDGTDFNDMFMDSVKRTIEELLNPDVPFTATDNEKNCTYCRFRTLCGR